MISKRRKHRFLTKMSRGTHIVDLVGARHPVVEENEAVIAVVAVVAVIAVVASVNEALVYVSAICELLS